MWLQDLLTIRLKEEGGAIKGGGNKRRRKKEDEMVIVSGLTFGKGRAIV